MRHRADLLSMAIHLGVLLLFLSGTLERSPTQPPRPEIPETPLVLAVAEDGAGTSGGSGGTDGPRPSDSRDEAAPDPPELREREKRLAPRLLTLRLGDRLDVPDLPEETELLLGPDLSHLAVPEPGLGLRASVGVLPPRSAGSGTGIGGRDGAGVGSVDGPGFGKGLHDPGSLDRLPVLVYKPDDPPYPERAVAVGARGEVILEIVVEEDGSTVVQSTLRSVPYCVELAWRLAEQYRFEPAIKDGKAVATTGIIIVRFELLSSRS